MHKHPNGQSRFIQCYAIRLRPANAALGMSQADLGEVIGKDRSAISRIDPASEAGELALLLIRCYRSLYVLVGGNPEQLRH